MKLYVIVVSDGEAQWTVGAVDEYAYEIYPEILDDQVKAEQDDGFDVEVAEVEMPDDFMASLFQPRKFTATSVKRSEESCIVTPGLSR